MLKHLTLLLLTFIISHSYAQSQTGATPIRLVKELIFIDVYVNDHEAPLNFLFDTGAGVTVIDTEVAGRLGLAVSGESNIKTAGKTLLSKETTHNKVRIGRDLMLDSITLVWMDLSHIGKYLGEELHGVIGYDLLSRVITETNIDRLEMRFFSPEGYTYPGSTRPLPLTSLAHDHFGMMIHMIPKKGDDPVTLNCTVDTGADNYLTLHNYVVKDHGLLDGRRKLKYGDGFAIDPTTTRNVRSKISRVMLHDHSWKNVPVTLEVDPVNRKEKEISDGLIGQRLLLGFNITYDLFGRVIYLEKRK